MDIASLLKQARETWGDERLTHDQIIVRLGKIFGDICRWQRNEGSDQEIHTDEELKKELGNIIYSTIRWADDLGYNPEECVRLAQEAQRKYKKR